MKKISKFTKYPTITQKGFSTLLGLLLFIVLAGGGLYLYTEKVSKEIPDVNFSSTSKENNILTTTAQNKEGNSNSDELKKEILKCKNSFQKENAIRMNLLISDCINEIAIKYKDYSSCKEQLEFRISQAAGFGERDVVSYANNYVEACVSEVAGLRDDLDVCSTLSDNESSYSPRTACYKMIAVNKKDISICNLITSNQNESTEICKRQVLAGEALNTPLLQWKKYTNTEYGFSFKYPPNVTIKESNTYSTSTKELLSVGTKEMGGFAVGVEKPEDYLFDVHVDIGNYVYLPDKKIWFDTDTKRSICSDKAQSYMNPNQVLNDRGYKVAHFGTGDACFSYADNVAVTKGGLLLIIGTYQDCDISKEEISVQKMILDSVDFSVPLENVCQ